MSNRSYWNPQPVQAPAPAVPAPGRDPRLAVAYQIDPAQLAARKAEQRRKAAMIYGAPFAVAIGAYALSGPENKKYVLAATGGAVALGAYAFAVVARISL